jgi:glucuronoarabinoxylan endo-1,4-beta-xylanase
MKSTTPLVSTSLASLLVLCAACGTSSDGESAGGAGGTAAGGATASGGVSTTGGVTATGGFASTTGGVASGGTTAAGGGPTATGGLGPVTGGTVGAGGTTTTGGATSVGGATLSGGATSVGGTTGSGGRTGRGGGTAAGGATGTTGGTTGAGGSTDIGGATGTTGGSTGAGGTTSTDVTVQLAQTQQTIDGFGINDTWSALTDAQAKAMFDVSTGIGLTILRVGMGSNGGFYNNNESSSIASAKKYGATTIIGSVWSPPADCKDNKSITKGGHLIDSCYESWSDAIAKFAADNGLDAMSAGNEPDFKSCGSTIGPPCNGDYDTTEYTANEMVAFVKKLGPKLKAAGVKLIAPEASEWIHFWSNISATGSTVASHPNSSDPFNCGCFANTITEAVEATCASSCASGEGYDYGHYLYKDSAAWAAIDIIGVHQYDTQVAEPWPADVNGGKPDKPIWQTEMSGVKYWPEEGPSTTIQNGVVVAGWVHNALTVGQANAWLWWWYNGTSTNEGLYNNGTDTKRHYTFGNFSKFIRPGYVRVDVTGNVPENVLLSAYKGTDGTVVVVAINKGSAAAEVPITIAGGTAPASMTPTVTSASDNLVAKTAVPVSGGTFTASLAGTTVTTFVGK